MQVACCLYVVHLPLLSHACTYHSCFPKFVSQLHHSRHKFQFEVLESCKNDICWFETDWLIQEKEVKELGGSYNFLQK